LCLTLLLLMCVGLESWVVASASNALPIVGPPYLTTWEIRPITKYETAYVQVNVTTSVPVANGGVILYYYAYNGISPSSIGLVPLDQFSQVFMSRIFGNETQGIYRATMPVVQNNTEVWGKAQVFDSNREMSWSDLVPIYNALTPNPKSSSLKLDVSILNVELKSMNLTLSFGGYLYDTVSPYCPFGALEGQYEYFTLPFVPECSQTGRSKFYFDIVPQEVTVFYFHNQLGHPELFPFDQYNYTFDLSVPDFLNASNIEINSYRLTEDVAYGGLIQLRPVTIPDMITDSYWDMQSSVQYFHADNATTNHPFLRVTILLNRRSEQVNDLLLFPTLSLFALLGFSVLLRGENEVRNRLVLYLNVFVFAYGFQSAVTALSITPLVPGGVSMIAKVGLSLIPCTVILAICTILGTRISKSNSVAKYGILDVFAVTASVVVLYAFSVTSVTEYLNHSPWIVYPQFTIFKLGWHGWFGPLLFAALLLPMATLGGVDIFHNRNELVGFLRRFTVPLICLAILLIIISLGAYYLSPNSVLLGVVIGGVVSGISLFFGQIFIDWYHRPVLEIDKESSPIAVMTDRQSGRFGEIKGISLDKIPYVVNRIRVLNKGRTAAENCKATLKSQSENFRVLVCWAITRERYVMTINAKDSEDLDVCAVLSSEVDRDRLISDQKSNVNLFADRERGRGATLRLLDLPRRILPTEEGWQDGKPVNTNRVLDDQGESDLDFALTVTAGNAAPCECNVTIKERQDEQGHIMSFR
jgi:hypothetical protein